jgi:hypothetical protein
MDQTASSAPLNRKGNRATFIKTDCDITAVSAAVSAAAAAAVAAAGTAVAATGTAGAAAAADKLNNINPTSTG